MVRDGRNAEYKQDSSGAVDGENGSFGWVLSVIIPAFGLVTGLCCLYVAAALDAMPFRHPTTLYRVHD